MCPDCEQSPCQCAEWERQFNQVQAEEAEASATFAETCIPELWCEGPAGLLVRKR